MLVDTSIVLVLRSPLEDPLSAKRVIPIKRRVQAFVILAIAFFVAAGFAANRYVTAAHPVPTDRPAQDSAVLPSPEGSAVKPPKPSPTKSRTRHTSSRPAATAKVTRTRKPSSQPAAAAAGEPAKNLSAEDLAVRLTNTQRAQHG